LSPAEAKKEYIEARKRAGDFLNDPKANIARLQAEMDKTKEKLAKVHDKPIYRRIIDRFKAKQHAVINLLAASMAYILAHRLHLKMKDNEELLAKLEAEQQKTSELRQLLRTLSTQDFAREVVAQATNSTTNTTTNSIDTKAEKSSLWFSRGPSLSSLPRPEALTTSLRQALEAKIGDEGLEDADRTKKGIQDVWQENEERIEKTDDDLAALAVVLAGEGSKDDQLSTTSQSKKRVFDM